MVYMPKLRTRVSDGLMKAGSVTNCRFGEGTSMGGLGSIGGSRGTGLSSAITAERSSSPSTDNLQRNGVSCVARIPKPCWKCGGVKEPGAGKRVCAKCRPLTNPTPCVKCGSQENKRYRRRYCDDCLELIEWRGRCRLRLAKRKPCSRCGGPKGDGRRIRVCPKCRALKVAPPPRACRNCGLKVVTEKHKRICVSCRVISVQRERVKKAEWQAANPKVRKRGRPKKKLQLVPGVTPRNRHPIPRIPARPLVAAIDRMIAGEDAGAALMLGDANFGAPGHERVTGLVQQRLGVQDRAVYRWRCGEVDTVNFDVADGVITRSPWLWWDVWNQDSVRLPALKVTFHRQRRTKGAMALARCGGRWYGDLGPDLEALAAVTKAFTGALGAAA